MKMKYCEACRAAANEDDRCPECGAKTREMTKEDDVRVARANTLHANMLEPLLKEAGIPYYRQGRMGAGFVASAGGMLESYDFFVPAGEYERALSLAHVVCEGGEEGEWFDGLCFCPLCEADIDVLTPVMTRAFDDDSRLFFGKDHGGPDGYDDGSFLRKWGLNAGAHAYRIDRDGEAIGCIILFIHKERTHGHLGTLFIDAPLIGQGYGGTAWRFAEHAFPAVREWTTETPAVSYRNHRFYVNKCGFQVYAVEGGMDRYEAMFQLRKRL